MNTINQNKADAMELSQEYNVPEQTIIFSKSLLDYFNQNDSTHPTAKLLEPYFRQDTAGKWNLHLDAHSERTGNILQAIAAAHKEETQSNIFKMSTKKLQNLVHTITSRLDL